MEPDGYSVSAHCEATNNVANPIMKIQNINKVKKSAVPPIQNGLFVLMTLE